MNRLVWECSRPICEIMCPDNSQSLINDISGLLSYLPMLKQRNDIVQSVVQINYKTPPSSIQRRTLSAPLAQKITMKQLQKLTQDHSSENEIIGRY